MKSMLGTAIAIALLSGISMAQQAGTINTLSVNPRQNQELTNSTGTETGQPSDAVSGSENQSNGLIPVTSNMVGSGNQGNMNQVVPTAKADSASSSAAPAQQTTPRFKGSPSSPESQRK